MSAASPAATSHLRGESPLPGTGRSAAGPRGGMQLLRGLISTRHFI